VFEGDEAGVTRIRVGVSGINGSRVVGVGLGAGVGMELVIVGLGWGRLVQQANQSLKAERLQPGFWG
jgi:hypothetical protein